MSVSVGVIGLKTTAAIRVDVALNTKLAGARVELLTYPADDNAWVDLGAVAHVDLVAGDHFINVMADRKLDASEIAVTFSVPAGAESLLRKTPAPGSPDTHASDDGDFHTTQTLAKLTTGKDPWPQPPPGAVSRKLGTEPEPPHDWYQEELGHLPLHARGGAKFGGTVPRPKSSATARKS
jgi:hypothetical protein